eukprot:6173798-Pleurochrysis_carterae.AAC.1
MAQHAHGVGHVRPRLRGAVEQSAYEGHVHAVDVRVHDSSSVAGTWDARKEPGTPSGRYVLAKCSMYLRCDKQTYPSPA